MNEVKTPPRASKRAQRIEDGMQLLKLVQGSLMKSLHEQGLTVSDQPTFAIACAVLNDMREYAHRGSLPIPDLFKMQRNEGIRREFNGRNLREVCDKYNVAKRTVYRVCSSR